MSYMCRKGAKKAETGEYANLIVPVGQEDREDTWPRCSVARW